MNNTIRVRIAPSPSGFLHIGTARTALFNWLFARQHGGTFILRIEDTDMERSDETYTRAMLEGFDWLGIDWDEGPAFEHIPGKGDYGPYRQSQRLDLYRAEAERLLKEGKAYKCFLSREEIETLRAQAREQNVPMRSLNKWRTASEEEIAEQGTKPYAIRFKVPEDGVTEFNDIIQGKIRIANKEIDDFVIVRPDGNPIFHLAVVVDDGLMKITHVIRGDDHLSNTPRHLMLFEALGYEVPHFAHLPMVLTEQGKKMSKRDLGANLLDWREQGYLPEALINYIAFLGWNPGDDREIFTREELIEAFSLERVSKSGAKFGLKRVQYLNGQHIRRLSPEELLDLLLPILSRNGFDVASKERDWLLRLTAICQEKLSTLNDICSLTDFFFIEPETYEEKAVKKHWGKEDSITMLEKILSLIQSTTPFSHDQLKKVYKEAAEEAGTGLGKFIHPTRLALTGKSIGPGLFELAELLGKDTCIARIERAIAYVKAQQASS